MGIGLIAVAGVLLLGAGVMILVANLSKPRGSSATIDQIQTYGYVAEATGGADAESVHRRPIDSLVGKIALVFGGVLVMIGSFWIKRISKLDV